MFITRFSTPLARALGFVVFAALAAPVSGCVLRERYDAVVADARTAQETLAACELQRARDAAQAAAAQQALDQKIAAMTTLNAALDKELRRQGTNVDALLRERGELARAVDEARAKLDELRRAREASEARAVLFHALALRFQRMIDAGSLRIVLRDGRMVLVLANDVLFDTGKVDIKPAGREALAEIAAVLVTIPDRRFQVAGHTDTVPISTPRFPSNWELSAGRAVEVAHFLIAKGVPPSALSAAGYGEFDPVAPNQTVEGKTRNRRIEITLVPNIDELVTVPTR